MKKYVVYLGLLSLLISCKQSEKKIYEKAFPLYVENVEEDRQMSSAMQRAFGEYEAPRLLDNELYTNFKYTRLKGFDYHGGDGTISRRDPSKIIYENGKYYVWYTYRHTAVAPQGIQGANHHTPSQDWDLAEIWYATSKDGFTWQEQGVAIPRPQKPRPGWRSVATSDILKFKDKYYLYYQAFNAPSGTYNAEKDAYDICPVAMSVADSPDGPWQALNKVVIPFGKHDEWDTRVIHDPSPFVHNGQIYLYYKSGMGKRDVNRKHWDCWGLAIADHPEGPFKKHPLNPIMNSGHETILFPFREGIAAIVGTDGIEHYTIQYAQDWVNFEIASTTRLIPTAAGCFSPDAFADVDNADGITWGLSHFINANGNWQQRHSILARFDCDLSLSTNDPSIKRSNTFLPIDLYFKNGLNKKQRERIREENERQMMKK